MGDKSPKSKRRDLKHKDNAKIGRDATAKSRQDSYRRGSPAAEKGKK
jgi:hypothetical protein